MDYVYLQNIKKSADGCNFSTYTYFYYIQGGFRFRNDLWRLYHEDLSVMDLLIRENDTITMEENTCVLRQSA